MRYFGTALVLALVAASAGTAGAQQQVTMQLSGGGVMVDNGSGVVLKSGGGEAGRAVLALASVKLTKTQQDSLAKLNTAHEAEVTAADARYVAATRALLTTAQQAQFDQNLAKQKEQEQQMAKMMATMQKQAQGMVLRLQSNDDEALKKLDEPDDQDAAKDAGTSKKK